MYVEAEKGTFVFAFFANSGADLGCVARPAPVWHMLCVHPVANFIPEAGLQNLGLVQNDFVLLPNKEQAHCLFCKSKMHCKKQHNTELGLHGLNIKQPAEPKGKISVSALALSQAISIPFFQLGMQLMWPVLALDESNGIFVVWEPNGASKLAGMKKCQVDFKAAQCIWAAFQLELI